MRQKSIVKDAEIACEERRIEILKLSRHGFSDAEIARQYGVDASLISVMRKDHLAELRKARLAIGVDLVEAEIERIENMIKFFQPKAEAGNPVACDMVIKLLNRKARYLGMDAPEKKEVTGLLTLEDLVSGSEKKEK